MSKKIMIVSGSPRKNGNTALIAGKIAEGAKAAGHEVALIELAKLRGFGQGCVSCFACQRSTVYRCAFKDEITPVLEAMHNYDTVVLAAPVYFFGAASQMKAFIDRFYSQVKYDNGVLATTLAKITFAVAVTAGDTREESGANTFVDSVKHLTGYLGRPEPAVYFAGGGTESVEVLRSNATLMAEAEAFGKAL